MKLLDQLQKIVQEIDASPRGVNLTKLTVLKKWFAGRRQLLSFAIWVAEEVIFEHKDAGPDADLFKEAAEVFAKLNPDNPWSNQSDAQSLYNRLIAFQNQFENQRSGPVRIINNWNLLIVEEALEIFLRHPNSATHGYKLASDYFRGKGCYNELNNSSRQKILDLIRFIAEYEGVPGDD